VFLSVLERGFMSKRAVPSHSAHEEDKFPSKPLGLRFNCMDLARRKGGGRKISEGVPPHTCSPPKFYTEKNQKLAVSPRSAQSTHHHPRTTRYKLRNAC
jgi:hypothetical protein